MHANPMAVSAVFRDAKWLRRAACVAASALLCITCGRSVGSGGTGNQGGSAGSGGVGASGGEGATGADDQGGSAGSSSGSGGDDGGSAGAAGTTTGGAGGLAGSDNAGTGGAGGVAGTGGVAGSGGDGAGGFGGTAVGGASGSAGSGGIAGSGGVAGTGGDSGSGGVAGTGGSAGSGGVGGNNDMRCGAGVTVAVGNKPLIDDFNDGNLDIIFPSPGTEDGRAGAFHLFGGAMGAKLENSGAELHFTGQPKQQWPAIGLPVASCYDASAYAGIRFKVKGTTKDNGADTINPLIVGIVTPPTTPEPEGTCPCTLDCNLCNDVFKFVLPSLNPTEYQQVVVSWGAFKQSGWGTVAPPGYVPQSRLIELIWAYGNNTGEFDIYIDDVEFIQ